MSEAMERIFFSTCLVFLLYGGLPLVAEETPVPGAAAPEIVFDTVEYDFGKAYQGENVVHSFVFRNKGGSDLVIERIKSSCGCTTALISAKTIPPGEKGEIKATFSTRGRKGRQRRPITVISNDPVKGKVTLTITGEIVVPLDISPLRLSLKEIPFGEEKRGTVAMRLSDKLEGITITEVSSSSPHIEARVDDMELPRKRRRGFLTRLFRSKKKKEEDEKGSLETTLRVRVKPGAPKGRLFGRVTIRYEGKKNGEAVIPVYARIVGNIAVKPERLFLGSISPEKGRETSIVVSDRKGRDLAIRKIETGSEFLEVEQKPVDASSIKLLVRVKPGAPAGAIRGRLQVFTDDKKEGVVEVPYSGNVRSPAPPR